MARKKVARMTDRHAAPDAGRGFAQQLAQTRLAHDELSADSGVTLTQDPAAQLKEKEQDGKEGDETEDGDDQELAQQLSLIHLDNKTKSQKKRSKKKESMKKKKAAERKALEEKTIRENVAEGAETAREKEIREMAQKMAEGIIKSMGGLQISEESTSTNTTTNTTTKTETETTAKEVPPKKNKKLNLDKLFEDWIEYFGEGDLEDWQRLCRDLGLPGDLPSKTKCRDATRGVHVNIRQFLDAQRKPEDVKFFKNVYKLANWTASKNLRVRVNLIPRGTPLRQLMRELSRY